MTEQHNGANNVEDERITVVRRSAETGGEFVEAVSSFPPTLTSPHYHVHPFQQETFEVLSGSVLVRIEGETHLVQPGYPVTIEPNVAHEIANSGSEEAVVLWRHRPALKTEQYIAAVSGRFDPCLPSRPRLLRRAAVHHIFSGEYRSATMPWAVQLPVLASLHAVARFIAACRHPRRYFAAAHNGRA